MYFNSVEYYRILSSIHTSIFIPFFGNNDATQNKNFGNFHTFSFTYSNLIHGSLFSNNFTKDFTINKPFYSTMNDYIDAFHNKFNTKIFFGTNLEKLNRKKVVIVGTGFSSATFLTNIDVTKFDVTVVSPFNYFTFTPILPLATSGTITTDSCLVPIRQLTQRAGKQVISFHEGWATDIDISNKKLQCHSKVENSFSLPYDYLILAFGAVINTFGIPGVAENSHFLKTIDDAKSIREHIFKNFEQASLPETSEEEKERLLSIVVAGAGPSGVEATAEIRELMLKEGKKQYPKLAPLMSITLVEMLPVTLPAYSKKAQKYSEETLRSHGVDVKLNTAVTKVTKDSITFSTKTSDGPVETSMKYGILIWGAGVGQSEIGKVLVNKIPEQKGFRFLGVNPQMQVFGAPNVFAMGDCATMKPPSLAQSVEEFYKEAENSPQGAGSTFMAKKAKVLSKTYPQLHSYKYDFGSKPQKDNLTLEEFTEYLKSIDKNFAPPSPTAQSAHQSGDYLADCFNKYYYKDEIPGQAPAFADKFAGKLAYVGGGKAIFDFPASCYTGRLGALWNAIYILQHKGFSAKFQYFSDLMHSRIFGRKTSTE